MSSARTDDEQRDSPKAAPPAAAEANQTELVRELFNRKAAHWSSKYSADARLAWRIVAFRRSLMELIRPPATVLDFGCGTGNIAHALSKDGYRVSACDIAESMIVEARRAFGPEILWSTLEPNWMSLPFDAASFDAIVCSSVLEYVSDAGDVLREWSRILRARGALVVSVPDSTHPVRRVETILASVARRPTLDRLATSDSRSGSYVRYLRLSKNRHSRVEWLRLVSLHGFSLSSLVPEGPLLLLALTKR